MSAETEAKMVRAIVHDYVVRADAFRRTHRHRWATEQQTGHRFCVFCNACVTCPRPTGRTG